MKLLASLLCISILQGPAQMASAQLVGSCSNFLDVIVVADASASVATEFERVREAVRAFVTTVMTNNPNIRIGLVFYNDIVSTQQIVRTRGVLEDFINNQNGGSGGTRTDLGIRAAIDMLQARTDVLPANIIVITDAVSQIPTDTADASQTARELGYTVYAVGVGVDEAFFSELAAMTADVNRIYQLDSTFEIAQTVTDLANSICAWTVCSSCSVSYGTKHVPHPTRCDKYYQCEKRDKVNAYEMNCPVGLLWHKTKMTCVKAKDALRDANAGCGYCRGTTGTTPNYAAGDNCEIYYTCAEEAEGWNLEVNCCPSGQSFDLSSSSCQNSAVCSSRLYRDSSSCRRYFQCNNVRGLEQGCCDSGQFFNETSGGCEDSSSCRGSCESATYLNCDYHQEHPDDKCRFIVQFGGTTWDRPCPSGTRFSKPDCRCVVDADCLKTVSQECRPDILVTFNEVHENNEGFTESGRQRWIDAKDVVYDETTGSAYLNGTTRLKIPFYSNNEQAFEEALFFRVSVKDDFVGGNPRRSPMAVLTNRGCGLSDVGVESSVSITMNPYVRDDGADKIGEVTFTAQTTGGPASVAVEYVSGDPNEWKELTLRVSPTGLEGRVERYERDVSGNRNNVVETSGVADVPVGKVLTSDCGLRIGQDGSSFFRGLVEYILFYTTCKQDVPLVGAPNPSEIQ